jgi:hypothetical protein
MKNSRDAEQIIRDAKAAGIGDEEVGRLLFESRIGILEAIKVFMKVYEIKLDEAHFRLRQSHAWSEYYGDTENQKAFVRSAFERSKKL